MEQFNGDILVVGTGFAGSVIARELAEAGKSVLMLERRGQIGGNMADRFNEHGILLHLYGPHSFHTTDRKIYDYVCRYGPWKEFRLRCAAVINGKATPSPFNFATVDTFFPDRREEIKAALLQAYPQRETVPILELLTSQNPEIAAFAQFLFVNNYRPYTQKQWGLEPREIDVKIFRRVPVRLSYREGYFDDPWQCLPQDSYTDFFRRLLDHPRINIRLNTDACPLLQETETRLLFEGRELPVVYTGAIDELLGYRFGVLPYRTLRFDWSTREAPRLLPAPITQYPQEEGYTRKTEYKLLTGPGPGHLTTVATEYPLNYAPGQGLDPHYPIENQENRSLYQRYRARAEELGNLHLCGRLAEYRYYNMDQVVASALSLAGSLLERYP